MTQAISTKGRAEGVVKSLRRRFAGSFLRDGMKKAARLLLGSGRLMRAAERFDSLVMGYGFSPRPRDAKRRKKFDAAPFGVNLSGYFKGEFGVGEAARSDARSLESAGVPFVLNYVHAQQHSNRDVSVDGFSERNPYIFNLVHINADMVRPFMEEKGPVYCQGKYNIGYWVWELPDFPERLFPGFGYFDEIWTCSSFCQDAISRVSPVPVIRAPHCIDVESLSKVRPARASFGLGEDEFVVFMVFDFLSIFERKNPLGAVLAFKKAFGGDKRARLVIKHINSDKDLGNLSLLKAELSGVNHLMIGERLMKEQLYSLAASCDCYLSLHRSEGFGLTIAEAMALGKPVVATDYSGNMDFMDVNNSFPVKYRLVELDRDYPPYEKGNFWADPDTGHAAEFMRLVYERRDLAKAVGERAREDIAERFSPEKVGRLYRERLEYLRRGIAG